MMRKHIVAVLVSLLLFVTGAAAQTSGITLDMKNAPLKEVFSKIENDYGYLFIYQDGTIDPSRRVSISVKDARLESVLSTLLGNGTKWKISGKQVSLMPAAPARKPAAPARITVKGKVTDAQGEGVIGAYVLERGTKNGALTDLDGNYSIEVSGPDPVLTFSSMGYVTQNVEVSGRKAIDVMLDEEMTRLDDVVVVGYGVQRKESIVGAISQVTSEALVNSGQTNVTNALAGKLSGVQTFQSSGQPGNDDSTIYIRGLSSWNSSTPLVMVDGVERPFKSLDPNEIESISVLKDASATAVFGAKGANGVIIVTTKTGQVGRPKMNLTVNYGIEMPQSLPKYVDSGTTLELLNEALRNDGSFGSQYSAEEIAKYRASTSVDKAAAGDINSLRYPNNNWYDLMLNNFAQTVNASYSVSGGSEKVKYYVNVGYNFQDSIVKKVQEWSNSTFSYHRINYRANIDYQVTGTTTLSAKVGGYTNIVTAPNATSVENLFTWIFRASPAMYPAYYPSWSLDYIQDTDYPDATGTRRGDQIGAFYNNPYEYISSGTFVQTTTNSLSTDLALKQKLDFITKGLSLNAKVALTTVFARTSQQASHSYPTYYINWDNYENPSLGNPWVSSNTSTNVYTETPYAVTQNNTARSTSYTFYWEGSVNYARKFADAHNVSAMALINQRDYVSGSSFPHRSMSIVGRVTYDYKGRYLFEVNTGYTGSEQFAPAYRFGFFPSAAVGYVPSKEKFWKKAMPWWSTMKIRYSDGLVGSDIAAASWLYYSNYTRSGSTIYESAAANASARWEKAHKRDLGFEMGWMKDNLILNVDLYDENRTDILIAPVVTMLVSSDYKDVNTGAMKKHGIDIEMKYRNTTKNHFYYEIGGMVSLNENRITAYEDPAYAPEYQKRAGKAYGSTANGETLIDGGYYTSVDALHGYPTAFATTSETNLRAGQYKYLDYNADGIINATDLHPVSGSTTPPVNYSANLALGWKGFSFGATLVGTYGKWIHFNRGYFQEFSNQDLIVHASQLDYWTPDNQSATHGSLSVYSNGISAMGGNDDNGYNMDLSGQTWRKSDYISIKDVYLSYKFSGKHFEKSSGVKGLAITLTGNNLYTYSKLIEGDPERTSLSNSYYPLMRSVKLGVKLDF